MNVRTSVVRVPNLDVRIADGTAAAVQNRSAEIENGSNGGSDAAVDDKQIVVCVQRQRRRIVRTFRLFRRRHEGLRESSRNLEERSSNAGSAEPRNKLASIRSCNVHDVDWTGQVRLRQSGLQDLTTLER